MDIKCCKECGYQPEHVLLDSGHAIICSKCKKIISGFKRKEWVIEDWNFYN